VTATYSILSPICRQIGPLIHRAKPEEATSETKKMLLDINNACLTQKHFTFKVSMPKGIVFDHEMALDLMYLEGLPVLHVVDTQKNFSSAVFVYGETVEEVLYAFLEC
jgi:hypothetical protein